LKEKILNDYLVNKRIDIDKLIDDFYGYVYIIVKNGVSISITEEDLERYKKVWIANEVRLLDYVETTADNVFGDIIDYNEPVTNRIATIRSMNKRDLDKVINQINLEHTASIMALPKEEAKE